jgi:hypothetical protein
MWPPRWDSSRSPAPSAAATSRRTTRSTSFMGSSPQDALLPHIDSLTGMRRRRRLALVRPPPPPAYSDVGEMGVSLASTCSTTPACLI